MIIKERGRNQASSLLGPKFSGQPPRFERSGEVEVFVGKASEMNIFRLAGDLSHVLSIFILLLRLVAKKQANGKRCLAFHMFLGVSLS